MSARTYVANVFFGNAMKPSRITIHVEECRWVAAAGPELSRNQSGVKGGELNQWVRLGNFSQIQKVEAYARTMVG